MANPFGGFVHTSPLSSLPHDPSLDLSSNCIRDTFGPTVQTVADCLTGRLAENGSTLSQIVSVVRKQCKKVLNENLDKLVSNIPPVDRASGSKLKINKARGPEHAGYVVDADPIRAALIVLLQHSLVTALPPKSGETVDNGDGGKHVAYKYIFHPNRARLIPRYPRYIDWAKRHVDENAAAIVEEVLVHGRVRTEDAVRHAMESLQRFLSADKEEDESGDEEEKGGGTEEGEGDNENGADSEEGKGASEMDEDERAELMKDVVKSLKKLIEEGYLELAPPLDTLKTDEDEGENEFELDEMTAAITGSKRKLPSSTTDEHDNKKQKDDEDPSDDPAIVSLLRSDNSSKRLFPRGSVWRLNFQMFHDLMRAVALGRLVGERYGDKVAGAGYIVTAALRLAAIREHSPRYAAQMSIMSEEDKQNHIEERRKFSPDDIMPYLPPTILNNFQNKAGGARLNLSSAIVSLSHFTWPPVVMEVEEAKGHPRGGVFEIAVRQLVDHLRGRVLHKVVLDHHGLIAARICAILETKGHLESDALAESAMIPAKETREILHRLYRDNYIDLFNLQKTKSYNPKDIVYLWHVSKDRMFKTVCDNACRAFTNLRLRTQHETEVGKEWIERAKEAGASDENDHEEDKMNYNKFCMGLERLVNATLQLDETIMVMMDF
mmetsp:Transcript_4803/g.7099  ORF Transcript_4803/g.7099 Transcript_4803/m.7099 type:complete len:663 (-) Transcript_4803:2388-4376(-)